MNNGSSKFLSERAGILARLRSLRNNLGWTLRGQIGFLLLFWLCFLLSARYLSAHDSNLNSAESNLLPFPLLGIVAMVIVATVFCGSWLMKIVITKQESESKNVTLNTPMGLYAFFLIVIPLLPIVGAHYKVDWLTVLPVLFIPIYATIPLIVICRRLDRFLEKQNSNQTTDKSR